MFNLSVIRTGKCVVVQGRDGEIALRFPSSKCAQWAEEHIVETVAQIPSIHAGAVQHAIERACTHRCCRCHGHVPS